jgi:NAD(P)-dependent dehydrogenase (short-subunit alcohol dehydrogenase family)
MKICITGNTRGIGLAFYNYFVEQGHTVQGFNTTTGLDTVVADSLGCDLFINNAYANGKQIDFLNHLYSKVGKMIVCGSVAAFYPDSALPIYSKHKKELADRVQELNTSNILMLHLSAKGYNDAPALLKVINLWLECPHITAVSFDATGEPNT